MSKYIKEFKNFEASILNIKKICSDWNDNFVITNYNDSEDYTFLVYNKRKTKYLCKTKILKQEAEQIISKLKLIKTYSPMYRLSISYHSLSYINYTIEQLLKEKKDKEYQLKYIDSELHQLYKAIK